MNDDPVQYYDYTNPQPGCSYYSHAQPRAVRKVGGTVFCYDPNGNMSKRAGSTIDYTSYNLPNVINAGAGYSSTLSYGAFRNRFKQIAVTPTETETTIYVAGIFEKVTRTSSGTEYRHRIQGGRGTAAIYTRTSGGSGSTAYVHTDHLGSPELITGSSGNVLVRPSFGAYGERRDGADWDGPPSAGDRATIANLTRRGFTGHEHLDAVGLIHMNGRVYEPIAGRFLSRDPFIDGFASSQGINGYGYVHNNPLTIIDPSGFRGCDDGIDICRTAPWEDFLELLEKVGGRIVWDMTPIVQDYAVQAGKSPTLTAHDGWDGKSFGGPGVKSGVGTGNGVRISRFSWEQWVEKHSVPGVENHCGQEGGARFPNLPGGVNVNDACKLHDDCYATRGANKLDCDWTFRRDIMDAFEEQGGNLQLGRDVADTYFLGVLLWGGDAYVTAQRPRVLPTPYRSDGMEWARLGRLGR